MWQKLDESSNSQYKNEAQKLQTINVKAGNSFKFKVQKIKFKYEYSADNKISVYCDAG